MIKSKSNSSKKQLPIQIQFTGKELTNSAGILPIHQFMQRLGLPKLIERGINLDLGRNTKYSNQQIILGTTLGIMAGHKRINQIESFSRDPLVRGLLGIEEKLDEDTIAGRFKRFTMRTSTEFMNVIGELSAKVHKKLDTQEDIFDLDSSVRTVYGSQEGAAKGFNPKKKGAKSYHPLFGFLNSTKECLCSWLRPGDTGSSTNVNGFFHECMNRLPSGIRGLYVRADSGFFDGKFLSVLESYHTSSFCLTYVIKVKLNKLLEEYLRIQDWVPLSSKSGWECTEFEYSCENWKHSRRFVALRRFCGFEENTLFPMPKYDYFCYVTNSVDSPFNIHEFYGDRGESENWIEAIKNQMFAGCLLTGDFWANEALWQCSVLAYNLSVWLRKLTSDHDWHEEPQTFRYWFIQLAGKIVYGSRKIVLKLYQSYHHKKRWHHIYDKLLTLKFT